MIEARLEKCARRKDEWAGERKRLNAAEDGGSDLSKPPVSTHIKRGLLSALSLRRFEKNTVEANHYGGATTDHFTLTE